MAQGTNILGYENTRVVVTGSASGMGEATARMLGELEPRCTRSTSTSRRSRTPRTTKRTCANPTRSTHRDAAERGGSDRSAVQLRGVPRTTGPLNCMLVNWVGLRYLTEGLLPNLVDGGAIASISSDAGIAYQRNLETIHELLAIGDPVAAKAWCEAHPESIREGYSFSKECIIVWTMMLALDLAEQRRIRINCIAPSPTDTRSWCPPSRRSVRSSSTVTRTHWSVGWPPEEQAGPLVLLNSDLAAIVTGTVLYTDQGFAGGLFSGQFDPAKMLAVDADA